MWGSHGADAAIDDHDVASLVCVYSELMGQLCATTTPAA
jgi:hypothetical protein